MDSARIAGLLQPFLEGAALSPAQLHHISTYIDILLRWNARINLTAIRNPEHIVTRHFGESLFAARHLFPDAAARPAAEVCPELVEARRQNAAHGVSRGSCSANDQRLATNGGLTAADLGAGAGFPGLPLKLWAPSIALTLIESNHKKAVFLREVARALTLTSVNVFNGRAADLTSADLPPAQAFDLVTMRAVERFHDALHAAAALVVPHGRLALLIGASQLRDAHAQLPTFDWQSPLSVPLSSSRILLVGSHQREPR
jgi:16S rRNA (guanine527-N7)-methyltransferase